MTSSSSTAVNDIQQHMEYPTKKEQQISNAYRQQIRESRI